MTALPYERIEIQPPTRLPSDKPIEWRPQGMQVQWGSHYGEDGAAKIGIGTGEFNDSDEDDKRIAEGGGTLDDLKMLWFGRSDINRLIRLLRRARDAAYGKDE